MQTTKGQILASIKRHGHETVDTLATELHLASMTVRQHLASLERDGLVAAAVERQQRGRPHYVYSLTEKGEESFPKRYDRLAAQILGELGCVDASEIADLTARERTTLVLRRIADRTIAEHAGRLAGRSLDERVREVVAILQHESGFVEWVRTDDAYEIRDYNCAYRRLTVMDADACTWHERVIQGLVGRPACPNAPADRSGACCRYVIPLRQSEDPCGTEPYRCSGGASSTYKQEVHARGS